MAYRVGSGRRGGGRRGCWRYDCLPTLLLALLMSLVGIASVQVALVHYYGASSAAHLVPNPYPGGPAGILPRLYVSPPPRINLHALLNRNVPSILANYRRIHQEINVHAVNDILERHELLPSPDRKLTPSLAALPDCPVVPPALLGDTRADINHTHEESMYSEQSIAAANPDLSPGGRWRPSHCHSAHKVAIIIPYRDRPAHLHVLLAHLHPLLQRQQIDYRIVVVEQQGNLTFNKARIMNVAFLATLRQEEDIGCFIFHDVDLIPENDRNMYSCPQQPRHMSVAIDEMNYQVPYEELVGGVFAIRVEHFFKVNGYSNLYWGWGAEDDDMAYRLQHVGLRITRPPAQLARYKMIRHKKRPAVDGRIRYRLLWTGVRRYRIDGLNSLHSLNYNIIHSRRRPLYTHILVDIGPPPPGF